jgi:hypothetical protein
VILLLPDGIGSLWGRKRLRNVTPAKAVAAADAEVQP